MVRSAVLAVLVLALGRACGQRAGSSSPDPVASAPETAASSASPAEPEQEPSQAAEDSPCDLWSGADIVAALSRKAHKPAVVLDGAESACDWSLPQSLRTELGMMEQDTPDTDVVIRLTRYDADFEQGYGTTIWDAHDPATLADNWMGAHHDRNPGLLQADPPTAVGDPGSVVAALPGTRWFELTLFRCGADTCRKPAERAGVKLVGQYH